jgi:hypothetical protein
MFIQHGQFGTSFNQDRALRIFNASMRWRKNNNVYGINKAFDYAIIKRSYRYFYK